jgi:acetate kinase
MKILVLNRGSSSVKCSLYDFTVFPGHFIEPVWKAEIEWKNTAKRGSLKLEEKLQSLLSDKKIDCIGHRIVHGGKKYKESAVIKPEVKKEIRKLSDLAPLHNLADLEGIQILEKLFPGKPQVAVFDTAFHHTLPDYAKIYPGPYEWFRMGIQRYGFHGTSFQYCSRRTAEILGKEPEKLVICHLGSGASLCAIKKGKSIDTTMGLTPLEGLMMDTRSGTVDPGILLYLLEKKKKTVKILSKELYEKSGLLGLSGISSDMRDILKKASEDSPRASLAIDVYVHRLTSMIGSMVVSLGGLDTLVFTAGIGENASLIREQVCGRLSFLGIDLSKHPKKPVKGDHAISSPGSKVKVLVIHTQEAFEIARECWNKMH